MWNAGIASTISFAYPTLQFELANPPIFKRYYMWESCITGDDRKYQNGCGDYDRTSCTVSIPAAISQNINSTRGYYRILSKILIDIKIEFSLQVCHC